MTEEAAEKPTIVLVHGAWHGSWCWSKLVPLLEAAGRTVETVDLPTVHAAERDELTMYDDSAAVSRAVDAVDGDVVLVAHSYGGVPATDGGTSAKVRHIVYIAAFALDDGESLLGAVGGEKPDWWQTDADGRMVTAGTPAHRPQDLFFGDVDPAEADAATARLRSQTIDAYTTPVRRAAWHGRSTTYIVTEDDAIFPAEAQAGLAARAGSTVHRLPTSHSPFLSQPETVAEIILAIP